MKASSKGPMNGTMAATSLSGVTTFQTGTFSGKEEDSATQWLRKLQWEMTRHEKGKDIELINLLQTVDFLLVGDAVTWAETTAARKLLGNSTPTPDTVAEFTALFTRRFLSKTPDTPAVHFDTEVAGFCQG